MAKKIIQEKKLTEEQALVAKDIQKFLKNKHQKFITLSASAGCGKSFLISEVLKKYDKNGDPYIPSYVVGITYTHMARLNLSTSIPNSISYASAVGMKMEEGDNDYDPLDMKFKGNPSLERLANYRIFVIDECSMLTADAIDLLVDYVRDDAKFIFLGDPKQLPPIGIDGDNDSPVFKYPTVTLKTPIRQEPDDEIYKVSCLIGEMIYGNIPPDFTKIPKKSIQKNGKGFAFTNKDKAIDSFVNKVKNGQDAIMCTFTNKIRKDINIEVRNRLWGNGESVHPLEGDLLIGTNQYNPKGRMIKDKFIQYEEPIFYNGQRFTIDKIKMKKLKAFYKSSIPDFGYAKRILDVVGDGFDVWHIKSSSLKSSINVLCDHDKQRWFKARRMLGEYCKYVVGNFAYLNQFTSKFASVDYGYCVTLYKVQGGTYDYVYVDYNDVMNCNGLSTKRKLQSLYVAMTRPKINLALF